MEDTYFRNMLISSKRGRLKLCFMYVHSHYQLATTSFTFYERVNLDANVTCIQEFDYISRITDVYQDQMHSSAI